MARLCVPRKLSSGVLAGLMVAYLAALTAAAANPAALPPHGVQMLTQGANVSAMAVLLAVVTAFNSRCSSTRWTWSWVTLAVLAGNLVVRGITAAVVKPERNMEAKFTRWDTAATVLGTVAVLVEMYYALVPRMRLRTTFFVLGLLFVLPLVGTVPQLLFGSGGSTFDAATAMGALRASQKAYTDFSPTKSKQNEEDRITTMTSKGKMYIAFAGTENSTDVKTDTTATDTRFPAEWLRPGDHAARVHSGFLRVYTQLRPRLLRLVAGVPPGTSLVLCGHSLGGALATLAALDLSSSSSKVQVYTFGQPQVGDGGFVKLFDARVPNAVRVVNPYDPVPRSLSAVFLHTKGYHPVSSFTRDSPVTAHSLSTYEIALGRPGWARVAGIFAPLVYVGLAAAGVAAVRVLILNK